MELLLWPCITLERANPVSHIASFRACGFDLRGSWHSFLYRLTLRFHECSRTSHKHTHSGVELPLLQLGTAHLITQPGIDATVPASFTGIMPERTFRQMELALQTGLRAFDTALIYRSHGAIGAVLGEWWRTQRLSSRNDVWITTKIFHPDARHASFGIAHMPNMANMTANEIRDMTVEHFETSLLELGVGYVDLLLLHWPSGKTATESDNNVTAANRQRRIAAWRVLEDVYHKGWARAIGVSNFAPRHLEQLREDGASVIPMVNQFEASVTLQYPDLLQYCLEHDIVPQAYSPFGRGLKELPPELHAVAARYPSKNPGQVAMKYLLQLGYAIVYLSNTQEHMVSNSDLFDFALTSTDMDTLRQLHNPEGGWGLPAPDELE